MLSAKGRNKSRVPVPAKEKKNCLSRDCHEDLFTLRKHIKCFPTPPSRSNLRTQQVINARSLLLFKENSGMQRKPMTILMLSFSRRISVTD